MRPGDGEAPPQLRGRRAQDHLGDYHRARDCGYHVVDGATAALHTRGIDCDKEGGEPRQSDVLWHTRPYSLSTPIHRGHHTPHGSYGCGEGGEE